ncbi:MAG: tRNA modification GTPase [Gemmataceae bacterium]|nr:tRNA modification GTPase [Gemmataceae bacterium]MDW8263894.1 tRNA modification GTPase [Gemmataceae bacterium]
MLPDPQDTIVALATAPGPGGRAIVRLSGPRVLEVLASNFVPADGVLERRRHRWPGRCVLPQSPDLPAELFLWPGPQSYTGQDVGELHTISCPPLVELVITRLLDSGARAAQPGEFTLRAFLAGKLDLARAEAVFGVTHAASPQELRQALSQLAGGLSRPLDRLRDDLLDLLADVEAGLDFTEEDIRLVSEAELLERLTRGMAELTLAQKQIDQRATSERPYRVVLAGRPNAGKSSLFNALAGKAAALVSPLPGTTRDYLMVRLELSGTVVELIDTAGWQPANGSAVDRAAQFQSRSQVEQADLVLLCVEAGRPPTPSERAWLTAAPPPSVVGVATKCDLTTPAAGWLVTSARTGSGIAELRSFLAEHARQSARPALAPSLSRCRHHVTACLDHLRRAHALVLEHDPPELLALELRGALDELGAVVGAIYTDDLLDRIFSRFCIGK